MSKYVDRKKELIKWSMETNTLLILHNGGAYDYSPKYDLFSFNPVDNVESYVNGYDYIIVRDTNGETKKIKVGSKKYDALENCDDNVFSFFHDGHGVDLVNNNYFYKVDHDDSFIVVKFVKIKLDVSDNGRIYKNVVFKDLWDDHYECGEWELGDGDEFKLFNPTLLKTYSQELINLYLVTKVNLG